MELKGNIIFNDQGLVIEKTGTFDSQLSGLMLDISSKAKYILKDNVHIEIHYDKGCLLIESEDGMNAGSFLENK